MIWRWSPDTRLFTTASNIWPNRKEKEEKKIYYWILLHELIVFVATPLCLSDTTVKGNIVTGPPQRSSREIMCPARVIESSSSQWEHRAGRGREKSVGNYSSTRLDPMTSTLLTQSHIRQGPSVTTTAWYCHGETIITSFKSPIFRPCGNHFCTLMHFAGTSVYIYLCTFILWEFVVWLCDSNMIKLSLVSWLNNSAHLTWTNRLFLS